MPTAICRTLGGLVPTFDSATGAYLGAGFLIALVMVAGRTLARRTGIPYPVFLVVAGVAAGFVPRLGTIRLDPTVVFLGFLPPLVYHAGIVTSPRELRAHALPIGLGALGLVLATTFAVTGLAAATVPALGWSGAFVLGAVVAPTDPVAATSVFGRLGVPPQVTTVLEGEGLVNDGVALALFSIGVAAVASPTSFAGGLLDFVKVAGGGTVFGLALGWLVARVRRPLRDTASQIVVSLVVPFAAYLPADALGLSGVLAALATGLVLGQRPLGLDPSGHIRISEFWEVLVFLLESVLFVLIGLQLHHLLPAVGALPAGEVGLLAGLTVGAVVVVRMVWWLAIPTLRWRPDRGRLDTGGVPVAERVALGWSGLRGAISLAAALSVPVAVSGRRFPGRDLIVFTTFCVILATLVGQGTTLPALLRRFGMCENEVEQRQRAVAHRRCAETALRLLDELAADDRISDEDAGVLRERYERRIEQARAVLEDDGSGGRPAPTGRALPRRGVERRLLGAQREALQKMHRQGEITFSVMRGVRRELDLEHARLDR